MKCFVWLAGCILLFFDSSAQTSPTSRRHRQAAARPDTTVSVSKSGAFTGKIQIPVAASTRLVCDSGAVVTASGNDLASFKEDLKKSLSQSVEALTDNSNDQYLFHKWLYDEAAIGEMADQLNTIKTSLDNASYTVSLVPGNVFYSLDTLLANMLSPNCAYMKVKRKVEPEKLSFTIERTEPVHALLAKYYGITINENTNKLNRQTSISDYYNFYTELTAQAETLKKFLDAVYAKVQPENLEALYTAHVNFKFYAAKSKYLKQLQEPWSREWLWSTGGTLKINPLDVTTYNILDTTATLDLFSKKFTKNEFLDRNNKMSLAHNATIQKIKDTAFTLNEIAFPIKSTERKFHNQFISLDASAQNSSSAVKNMDPVSEDDKIYTVVHNVRTGRNVKLIQLSSEKISGGSPTELALKTIVDSAVKLSSLISPNISTITAILKSLNNMDGGSGSNFSFSIKQGAVQDANSKKFQEFGFTVNTNRVITVRSLPAATAVDSFWVSMADYLRSLVPLVTAGENSDLDFYSLPGISSIQFDSTILERAKRKFAKRALDSIGTRRQPALEKLADSVVSYYVARMFATQIAPIVIDSARKDSMLISKLIDMINKSTLPLARNVQAGVNPDKILRTDIQVINDDAVNTKKTMLVADINEVKKDTARLSTFNYKRANHTLFEVSAGIVYTFGDVRVNTVTAGSDQKLQIKSSEDNFRMLLGLHVYPFKHKGKRGLFKVDEPFFGNVASRFNFMVGVGVPKPLDNLYAGIGYDLGPGIKLNTGVHLFKYRKYELQNNTITKESATYAPAVPFVSLSVNPSIIFEGIIKLFSKS